MSSPFVHLHIHTEFSFLDGAIKLNPLMEKVASYGMNAVAITDHGNLSGMIKFYKKAQSFYKEDELKKIKPIIGCELYVASGSRFDRNMHAPGPYHLVLWAENETGYYNLIRLVSLSHLEGFYFKPRVDYELLERYSEGLVASSACIQGEVAQAALKDGLKAAEQVADFYAQIFKNRFYLEVQPHSFPEQQRVNDAMLALHKKMELPLLATNDCHYLEMKQAKSHDVLLCIQTKNTIREANRFKFQTNELYFKSPQEMIQGLSGLPGAIENTLEVAERCNLKLSFGQTIYPEFEVPEGHTLDTLFEKKAWESFEKIIERIGEDPNLTPELLSEKEDIYRRQIEYEIDLIKHKGFSGYFLIVQDFIQWAKQHRIPVGPGRGSAAGCLVSYAMGITNIDPIQYGLLFERFLNPERKDNPDIDIDFCERRRDEVIQYVTEKYSKECVAQIQATAAMNAKAVVRDVGRAMGIPISDADKLVKLFPIKLDLSLDEAERAPEVKKMLSETAWGAELWEIAKDLEGLARHPSTHAAGVVISKQPLLDIVPLKMDKDGKILVQLDKKDVEDAGLVKFDFLGLTTLSVIDKTLDLIEKTHRLRIDLDRISMKDPNVFQMLTDGHTTGVFQFESPGMKALLKRLEPTKIEDLIAINALYRPGPIQSGLIDEFIDCKKGIKEVAYEHPSLHAVLEETYGMMVYQEQVMRAASVIAGFSLGDADLLRRAMGKKDKALLEKQKTRFLAGAKSKGIDEQLADRIFRLIEHFAGYGFNKSHSTAYAVLAYQTAYLKRYYPAEFMASLLTMHAEATDKVISIIAECRDMNIEVLPPDVNYSFSEFSVEDDKIRFGLHAIKNVGEGAAEAIVNARESANRFISLAHFCEEVDLGRVTRRVIEHLVKAGVFDSVNKDRHRLLAVIDEAVERAARIAATKSSGQLGLFGAKRMGPPEDSLPEAQPWSKNVWLMNEREALGFYFSGHPLDQMSSILQHYASDDSATLREINYEAEVRIGAIISDINVKETKNGELMAQVICEDAKGSFIATFLPKVWRNCEQLVRSDKPLLLMGRTDGDFEGRILMEDIIELENAPKVCSKEIHFHLRTGNISKGQIELLYNIMMRYQGNCRAILHVEVPEISDAVFRLPSRFSLSISDALVQEIENLFGSGVLTFQ